MPPSPPIGEGDVLRAPDTSSAGAEVSRQVQFQLTGAADVKAAHAYFQPTSAETAHLPAMEAAHMSALTPGSESLAMHLLGKAGEGAAMGAGAQAISPMIQMIMRMPGHLGLMSSFFEFLGHFFMGQDILSALDPTHLLAQHAEAAMSSLSHMGSQLGSHLGVGIHLMPHDALLHGVANAAGAAHSSLLHGAHDLTAHVDAAKDLGNLDTAGKDVLNNSGYAEFKPTLEKGTDFNSSLNDGGLHPVSNATDPQYVAWDSSSTFRPTLTGAQMPPATNVQLPDPNNALNHQFQQSTAPPTSTTSHSPAPADVAKDTSAGTERGSLLEGRGHAAGGEQSATTSDATNAGDGATTAGDTQPATIDYTVKHGDNLWDIAHKHFGDSTKWTEIYKMNQNAIGDNPRLIHEGTQLQLPGDGKIASGDYVVKPGDNLWDISQSHLGGGQHWPELYHANEAVVGSNPSLIHPGQHLSMSGDGAGQLASADAGWHAQTLAHAPAAVHHGATHIAQHSAQHSVHLAHAHTPDTHHIAQAGAGQHAPASHGAGHVDHAKVASAAGTSSASPPHQAASSAPASNVSTAGQEVALRAQPASLGKFSQISGDAQ